MQERTITLHELGHILTAPKETNSNKITVQFSSENMDKLRKLAFPQCKTVSELIEELVLGQLLEKKEGTTG